MLQSSVVFFQSQNNSPLILIFILFLNKGHNSTFSGNRIFFPLKNSWKRIMPENEHFIICELKQLRNALRKDIPRLKRRKWFFTCTLHLSMIKLAISGPAASLQLLPSVQQCWDHYSKICSCPQPFLCIFICHTNSFPPEGSVGRRQSL